MFSFPYCFKGSRGHHRTRTLRARSVCVFSTLKTTATPKEQHSIERVLPFGCSPWGDGRGDKQKTAEDVGCPSILSSGIMKSSPPVSVGYRLVVAKVVKKNGREKKNKAISATFFMRLIVATSEGKKDGKKAAISRAHARGLISQRYRVPVV